MKTHTWQRELEGSGKGLGEGLGDGLGEGLGEDLGEGLGEADDRGCRDRNRKGLGKNPKASLILREQNSWKSKFCFQKQRLCFNIAWTPRNLLGTTGTSRILWKPSKTFPGPPDRFHKKNS